MIERINPHLPRLNELRTQLEPLLRESAATEGAPLTHDEVRERVHCLVAASRDRAIKALKYDMTRVATGVLGVTPFSTSETALGVEAGVAGMLALCIGVGPLMDAIEPMISSLPEGIDVDRRADRLAELETAIRALEEEEEALIVQAEAEGFDIARRMEVTPAVVLGPHVPREAVRRTIEHAPSRARLRHATWIRPSRP